jgi:hypothetical protein
MRVVRDECLIATKRFRDVSVGLHVFVGDV